MKKMTAPLLFTGCLLAGMGSAAQNAAPEGKPMKSTLTPQVAMNSSAAIPSLQKGSEQQSSKSIVPAGESKPMDTRVKLSPASEAALYNTKPIAPAQPGNPVAPVKKEEVKTGSPLKQQK